MTAFAGWMWKLTLQVGLSFSLWWLAMTCHFMLGFKYIDHDHRPKSSKSILSESDGRTYNNSVSSRTVYIESINWWASGPSFSDWWAYEGWDANPKDLGWWRVWWPSITEFLRPKKIFGFFAVYITSVSGQMRVCRCRPRTSLLLRRFCFLVYHAMNEHLDTFVLTNLLELWPQLVPQSASHELCNSWNQQHSGSPVNDWSIKNPWCKDVRLFWAQFRPIKETKSGKMGLDSCPRPNRPLGRKCKIGGGLPAKTERGGGTAITRRHQETLAI